MTEIVFFLKKKIKFKYNQDHSLLTFVFQEKKQVPKKFESKPKNLSTSDHPVK